MKTTGQPASPDPRRWRLERARHSARRPAPPQIPGCLLGAEVSITIRQMVPAALIDQGKLLESWAAIVGDPVARHTRPGKIEDGVLTIYTDHSMWLAELERAFKPQILEKIRRALPRLGLRRVRFALDPDGAGVRKPAAGP